MTADCRDDKYVVEQFRKQNAVYNMLVRKFSFAPVEAKIQLIKSYDDTQFMDVLSGVIYTRILLENLLSVIVTHSNDLLMSPDTPARVSYFR